MSNSWFQFKLFKIFQDKSAMKVGIDSVLLGSVASFDNPERVLDIGAGTGLLSLMAEQRTNAQITAVEIDKDTNDQCIENVKFNNKTDNIHVICDSFQQFAENCHQKFDHIICNPPYFKNTFESPNHKRNIARQNLTLAPEELLKGVKKVISDHGILSIIIPIDYTEEYMQLSVDYVINCFNKIDIFPKKGKKANRCILEFSDSKKNFNTEEIIIRDTQTNKYTAQYKTLTKDFYLEH